jgi:retinol dehydrogenase 12
MEKPICLITGATEGVGKATAMELAKKGFTIVIAARNEAKVQAVARQIKTSTGGKASVDYILVDFKSLKKTRQLAETFRQRYPRLDVLINNVGIFSPTVGNEGGYFAQARTLTDDGYETTYQVNYLSVFYLTHLLLDELKKSEQGKIINLSSSVHAMGKFDVDNLQGEKQFSTMGAYSASKLLVLMFTLELAKRLHDTRITANAVHPGIVRTQMFRQAPGIFKVVGLMSLPMSIAPEKGAATSVYLATSPEAKGITGKYFANSKVANIKSKFTTDRDLELLWDTTVKSLQQADARIIGGGSYLLAQAAR